MKTYEFAMPLSLKVAIKELQLSGIPIWVHFGCSWTESNSDSYISYLDNVTPKSLKNALEKAVYTSYKAENRLHITR